MGLKGGPDTKKNWPTDRRSQIRQLQMTRPRIFPLRVFFASERAHRTVP
jgi:hypothetical protein